MRTLRLSLLGVAVAGLVLPAAFSDAPAEAPAGFDNLTNGFTADQLAFDTDRGIFEEVETIDDGLGPVYNAQSCAECHQNPVTGAISQITEVRAGHFDGVNFVDHPGGSLINDRAIDASIQERVLGGNEVRTFRTSLNTLGDGFVEAIDSNTLVAISNGRLDNAARARNIARARESIQSAVRGARSGATRRPGRDYDGGDGLPRLPDQQGHRSANR